MIAGLLWSTPPLLLLAGGWWLRAHSRARQVLRESDHAHRRRDQL